MSLIKHRPKLHLLLPSAVSPGQRLAGVVVLEARREVRVEQVAIQLLGAERSVVGSGKHATHSSRTLLRLGAVLSKARTLRPGAARFAFELELPAGLPPSYEGRRATVEYSLRVSAPIRWWPDARSRFKLQVIPQAVAARTPTPRLYASDPAGPRARERHLECSLSDDAIHPGQPLVGSVALFNVAYHRYRELQLSLVATERAFTARLRRSSSEQRACYTSRIPLADPAEGEAIPFALALPAEARPSVESELWSYSWELEVRVDIPWGRDLVLRVPLSVLPPGSTAARPVATPVVGSARVQAIWRAVAADHGLRHDGEQLVGEHAGTSLTIAREHRGGDGIFLVGALRWPSLGLMLDGGRRSGFRRLFHRREVALDDPHFARDHYLTGREEAQVQALARSLLRPLAALEGLLDLDDEGLRAERRDAGQSRGVLSALAAQLLAVARALPSARALLPPPALMRDALAAWQALARELGGQLEPGGMAVRGGSLDGLGVLLASEWLADGSPRQTVASVTPPLPIDEGHRLEWQAGTKNGPAAPRDQPPGLLPATGALPTEAAVLVQELAETARAISIREDRLELVLEAPLLDPATALPLLRKLVALALGLGPRGGPYR